MCVVSYECKCGRSRSTSIQVLPPSGAAGIQSSRKRPSRLAVVPVDTDVAVAADAAGSVPADGGGSRKSRTTLAAVGQHPRGPPAAELLAAVGITASCPVWHGLDREWRGLTFGEYAVDEHTGEVIAVLYPDRVPVRVAGYTEERFLRARHPGTEDTLTRVAVDARFRTEQ